MIPAHNLTPDDGEDPLHLGKIDHSTPDGSVTIYIDDDEMDFHIDAAARALPDIVMGYIAFARRLGYMPMEYDECPPTLLPCGAVRMYLIPIEPISDVAWEMPSLVPTGMGPYSMEIPVVDPKGVVANYEIMDNTQGIPIVRMDTPPPIDNVRSINKYQGGKHRA